MLKWRDLDFFFETNKEGPDVKSRLSTICNDDNNNRLTVWTLTCRLGKFRKSDEFFTYIYIYIYKRRRKYDLFSTQSFMLLNFSR